MSIENKEKQNIKLFTCKQCGAKLPYTIRNANFCPNCCALLDGTKKFIDNYFNRTNLNNELAEVKRLFLKNEYVAAARVATIVLERIIKRLINEDKLQGSDLMAKAFSFDFDEKTNTLIKEPLIKVNTLQSISERNEQDGMKFICMGLMKGARNVLAHSIGHTLPFRCLNLISQIDYIIKEIVGSGSFAQDLNK